MKNKKILAVNVLLGILCVSCNNKQMEQEKKDYITKGDTVFLQNNTILNNKLKVTPVSQESFSKEVVTAGTVQAIPTQFAYIAPPFSGRVLKSHIRLGQKVGVNTPLFDIVCPEFTDVQKEFFQAQSEKEMAEKDLKRKEDLLSRGVGSQKELEEAYNLLSITEKEYENAQAALQVYQVNPKEMFLGQPLTIYSPISGHVIDNNIVTGQYVKDDTEPLATVADLSQVWIVAQVKEKDIRYIHEGDNMDIEIAALPEQTIKGTVYHVDELVDEETRSIKVLSICDNRDELLKLGMYTTVYFTDKPSDYITIPEKALLQGEDDSYVYVQLNSGTFLRTPVTVEFVRDGKAAISKGLKTEDTIICEGGYYLK